VEDYGKVKAEVVSLSVMGEPSALLPKKDAELFMGMKRALEDADNMESHVPSFQNHCTASEGNKMAELIKGGRVPTYSRSNYEHLARFHGADALKDIVKLNAENRIANCLPPTYHMYNPGATVDGDDLKSKLFSAVQGHNFPDDHREEVDLTPRLGDSKSKDPRVRRRQTLAALLRETRPQKVLKLVGESQKFPPAIRRLGLMPGESVMDPATQAFLSQFPRGLPTDEAQAIVSKVGQLLRQGRLDEAIGLIQAAENKDAARNRTASPLLKVLQRRWFTMRVARKTKRGQIVTPEEQSICRNVLVEIKQLQVEANEQGAVETALVALINLEDWDFLLTLPPDPKFPLVQTAQIIISLLIVMTGGTLTMDVKKTCANLFEAIKPLLVPSAFALGSGKRARASAAAASEAAQKDEGKRVLCRFLKAVRQPAFLQVMVSMLVALYNEKADDANSRIHGEVAVLPFVPTASQQGSANDVLDVLQMIVGEK